MPRRQQRQTTRDEDEDDEEVETEGNERDFVLARLAIARGSLTAAVESIDECISEFADPSDDEKGKERQDALDAAVEAVGFASRALESAEEVIGDIDPEECEPWDSE